MASIINFISVVFSYFFVDPGDLHVTHNGRRYSLYPLWVGGLAATALWLAHLSYTM